MAESAELRPLPMNYFQLILRRFGADEASRAVLLEGLGLGAGEAVNADLDLNFAQQTRLSDNLNQLHGDGWILDAPEVWEPASQGALGMAVQSAATVGEAISTMTAYTGVHAPNYRMAATRRADQILLRHSLPRDYPASQVWAVTASVFLAVSRMLQIFLGDTHAHVAYEFERSRPDYADRVAALLGGPVRWRSPINAAIIPRTLLSFRSPLADPITHRAGLRLLEQARQTQRSPEGVKGRVEHLLVQAPSGRLSLATAARTLGLSERTLVRRLAESGVTNRKLVDAELKSRARRWLDAGELSRDEIGERLGFADATSFRRACRRWFNRPP